MQNEEKTEAIKLVGDAMTYQMNDGEPYEFRDDFCEYSESKNYAAEKITLSVSPYEFEMLLSGIGVVISDYEGPYYVDDYYKFQAVLEEIKERNLKK